MWRFNVTQLSHKKLDTILHKQYTLEKFKDGHTGRNFVTDEPEFIFEKPKFAQKIVLPLCSEVVVARTYLQNRKIDPAKFYFAENFDEFVRTFEGVDYSYMGRESRIIIPLFRERNLIGFQGRSLGPNKIKYITVMLDDEAPKIYGLDTIRSETTSLCGRRTFRQHICTTIRLLCVAVTVTGLIAGGLAILCCL